MTALRHDRDPHGAPTDGIEQMIELPFGNLGKLKSLRSGNTDDAKVQLRPYAKHSRARLTVAYTATKTMPSSNTPGEGLPRSL